MESPLTSARPVAPVPTTTTTAPATTPPTTTPTTTTAPAPAPQLQVDRSAVTVDLAQATQEGANSLLSGSLPWLSGTIENAFAEFKRFANSAGVEQHWPHSCTAAAAQAAWKTADEKGYAKAEKELAMTGSTTLPGPPPVEVTLDGDTQAWIDQKCKDEGLSDAQRAEMYMQAALMEYGTQGHWSPEADVKGEFDGIGQKSFNRMAEAVGVELTRIGSIAFQLAQRQMNGEDVTRAEVVDDLLKEALEASGGQPVLLTVDVDGQNHAVFITADPEGGYKVVDGDGNPMPPGVPQPISAEDLEKYVPDEGGDVSGRRVYLPTPIGGELFP